MNGNATMAADGSMGSGDLWAVCAYYNPGGYGRRLANFRHFRAALGIPLLAVELSAGAFELGAQDADIMVQLRGETRMWQKERLLNIGIEALPASAAYVAWLDADGIFLDPDWHLHARDMLAQSGGMVQPFDTLVHLGPDAPLPEPGRPRPEAEVLGRETSMAASIAAGGYRFGESVLRARPSAFKPGGTTPEACGHAWVARRGELFCGLLDILVTGLADLTMLLALAGEHEKVHALHRHPPGLRAAVAGWRARALESGLLASARVVPGTLEHLWHGAIQNREYRARGCLLGRHGFDPGRDLVVTPDGLYAWREPEGPLARAMEEHYRVRLEDG